MPLYWIRHDAKDENELWHRLLPFNDHIGVVGQAEGPWYILRGADRDQMRRIWRRTKRLARGGGQGTAYTASSRRQMPAPYSTEVRQRGHLKPRDQVTPTSRWKCPSLRVSSPPPVA